MSFLSQPLQDILIGPSRQIGTIKVQVILNERAGDVLTVTKQPVQQGASIADHSFLEPTVFSAEIQFSSVSLLNFIPVPLKKIYQSLLDLQATRFPFDITTPKRIYRNMLITGIVQTTDKVTENVLRVNMDFQQVIIVPVNTVIVPRAKLKTPGTNGATQAAGNKSALLSGVEAVQGLFTTVVK